MATKFITIRIPIPTLSWFKKEEVIYEPEQDQLAKIAELKARIAAFRSSYEWTKEPTKVSQAQPEPVVAEETQQPARADNNKGKDLDAMKAKLMGKRR